MKESVEGDVFLDSNVIDSRFNDRLLDSNLRRRNLSIPAFKKSNLRFQYLDEDEWGLYFTLIRITNDSTVLWVEQDTFTKLHSFFEYQLDYADYKSLLSITNPILNHSLKFPSSQRHLTDGGDISLIFKKADSIFIRHWQHNEFTPRQDEDVILSIVDSLKYFIKSKGQWWQD